LQEKYDVILWGMNLEYLVKLVNRGLNSVNHHGKSLESIARQIIIQQIRSRDANFIFRNIFDANVYRFVKRMIPSFEIVSTAFGFYINNLQFYSVDKYFSDTDKESKLAFINIKLSTIKYDQLTNNLLDLSEIETIKF
jgi:hypothetical protein